MILFGVYICFVALGGGEHMHAGHAVIVPEFPLQPES